MRTMLTRRDFGKKGVMCGGAVLAGFKLAPWPIPSIARLQERSNDPFSGGRQLGVVDFVNPRPLEMDTAQGNELDCRLHTDPRFKAASRSEILASANRRARGEAAEPHDRRVEERGEAAGFAFDGVRGERGTGALWNDQRGKLGRRPSRGNSGE